MIRHILYGILMWLVCLYAFYRGGWAERFAAAIIIVATYLTALLLSPLAIRYHQVELATVVVDVISLALFIFISLRSEKFWPLWLASMHGLTTLSHLAPFVPHVIPWAYHRAVAVWIYPMLVILALATRWHHREKTGGASFEG